MAFQVKIISLEGKNAESEVAEFLNTHAEHLNPNQIIFYQDRFVSYWNDEANDITTLRGVKHYFQRELNTASVQLAEKKRAAHMTRRKAEAGKARADDVMEAEAQVRDVQAEIDYNKEQLVVVEQQIADAEKAH